MEIGCGGHRGCIYCMHAWGVLVMEIISKRANMSWLPLIRFCPVDID